MSWSLHRQSAHRSLKHRFEYPDEYFDDQTVTKSRYCRASPETVERCEFQINVIRTFQPTNLRTSDQSKYLQLEYSLPGSRPQSAKYL